MSKIKKNNRSQSSQSFSFYSFLKKNNSIPFIISSLILALLTYLFYYPSINYDFQFDDVANIKKLFSIRHATFSELFFSGSRWISYWINTIHYKIAQFDPWIYRLSNITFHTCSGLLLFAILLRMLSGLKENSFFKKNSFFISFVTAGLFLLHPVQTQTVSYVIQGQLEGLATLFTLAIVYCFLQFTQSKTPSKKIIFSSLIFILGFFACGTKEIVIVAPFLLFIVDWFFVAQGNIRSIKSRLVLHATFWAWIWGLYLYLLKPHFFAQVFGLSMEARNNIGNILTENPADKIYPLHFFISQFKVILHYIWMFIWPFSISVEYDWKLVKGFFSFDCFFPFIILCCLWAGIFYLFKKNRTHVLCFGALWFFISIAPRSSIIPSSELLTDYKTYLASVGICFILAAALVKALELSKQFHSNLLFHNKKTEQAIITVLLCIVGFGAYSRNKVWRSGEEFWYSIIQNAPGKARAYNNYAVAISEKGRYEEAIPYYKKAILMDRRYPDPLNNIAVAYSIMGKTDLAIGALQQAIKIQPRYPEGYNNLASFFIAKNEFDKAEKLLNVALQLRKHYGKAYFNKGKIRMHQGKYEEAFKLFKHACTKADLDNEAGYKVYASISLNVKKYSDAIFAYKKLLQMKPHNREYIFNLANAYLLNKNYDDAIGIYERLLAQNAQDARTWYNLGESYYRQENYAKALEGFTKAKQLRYPLATVYLRAADCLHRLGKNNDAVRILHQVVTAKNMPEQIRKTAQDALHKLRVAAHSKAATAA